MSTLTIPKSQLVTTQVAFCQWMNRCKRAKTICFDTETTGLDWQNDELVGIVLAVQDDENQIVSCYIPLRHQKALGKTLSWHDVKVPIRALLKSGKPIVTSNGMFDALIMRQPRYDAPIVNVHDIVLMSYALTGNLHYEHGFDALCKRIFGHDTIKFKDVVKPDLGVLDFSYVRLDVATHYAGEDGAWTLLIAKVLQAKLKEHGMYRVYDHIDRPLLPVLVDMKLRGILVDWARLEKLAGEWHPIMAELEAKAHKQAGKVFNLRSSPQVADILYLPKKEGGLGIKVENYTDGGKPAADKDTLENIHGVPVVDTLLEFKQYATLVSTFVEGLPKKRNELTGRVHTDLKITSTKTRRFSSAGPNLQNIPTRTENGQELREAFIAAPGYVLISADYSQIEYRILAHVSKDPYLLEAFRTGVDMHAKMAADVRGGKWEDYHNKADKARYAVRGAFKNVNFATVYGAGPAKVAHMSKIELAEAYILLNAHREMCPGVYDWKEQTWELARTNKFVVNLFGGRTHVPYINSNKSDLRGHAERLAINAPIQGGAAELIRLAMPIVHNGVWIHGAHLLLQVHDELVVECPKKNAEFVAWNIKEAMQDAADTWIEWEVPIIAETGIGPNWREAK